MKRIILINLLILLLIQTVSSQSEDCTVISVVGSDDDIYCNSIIELNEENDSDVLEYSFQNVIGDIRITIEVLGNSSSGVYIGQGYNSSEQFEIQGNVSSDQEFTQDGIFYRYLIGANGSWETQMTEGLGCSDCVVSINWHLLLEGNGSSWISLVFSASDIERYEKFLPFTFPYAILPLMALVMRKVTKKI